MYILVLYIIIAILVLCIAYLYTSYTYRTEMNEELIKELQKLLEKKGKE